MSLTIEERIDLAEAWIKEKGKIPTQIVQVGGCAFRDAQKLASHAEKIGATAIATLPNMFVFPSHVDQLVDWVAEIASAAPNTPCLYYHIPKNTKVERNNSTFQFDEKFSHFRFNRQIYCRKETENSQYFA